MLIYLASFVGSVVIISAHEGEPDYGFTAGVGNSSSHNYSKPLWNATYTDMLKRDLLATYDKFARPNQHDNATRVFIGLVLIHVHLDDTKSLFTTNAWVHLEWRDEKLRWNASEYGGIKLLHLADHEIWEPDIVLYNNALGNNIDHFGNTHCLAKPNGDVLWIPPSQFVVFCDLDLLKWPFDQHTCSLRLGSWTYSGEQIDLQINHSGIRNHAETIEWYVVNTTRQRSISYANEETYIDVVFNITVRRRSSGYRTVVITPAISVMFLTLTLFWLPPHGKERYFLSGLTAILIGIFLVYFTIRLPTIGPNTPLIILFYAYNLIMISLSVVLSILFYNISSSQVRLPRIVVNTLRGPMASVLFLPSPKATHNYTQHSYDEDTGLGGEELRDYDNELEDRRILKKGPQDGWALAATALDRVVFIVYVILLSSLAVRSLL